VDGARSLGRIIERDMNIIRENFGTFRARSVVWCSFVPILQ